MRRHRWQPTRLPRPRDSPDQNTGVSCHFLLQCMKVKSQSEVTQSCPTFSDPMDCSLPGSSVHGIFQARALEWVASTSNMLYRNGKSRHPCLVPDLRGKAFSLSPSNMVLAVNAAYFSTQAYVQRASIPMKNSFIS